MAVALAATSAVAVLAAAGTSNAAPRAAAASGPKVCLVTDIGGLNDRGFNQLAYKGLKQAKSELGADIAVKQSTKDSDYVPNLQACGAQGYQLIVAVGFLMENAVGQVSKQFPNAKFAIIDDSVKSKGIAGAKNVRGLLFKEQESGYLVGYLTGLLNKKGGGKFNGKNLASTVGGLSIPAVNRYIAGFRAGVKKGDPSMKTPLNGYSNDFIAQDKCKQLALSQIARGSDVVFQVAGQCGLGALLAAKEKGVWGIGVDADQGYIGPHVLASAIKRVDSAVFLTAKAVKDGSYKGGVDFVFTLKQDGTGIASINKAVPAAIKKQVDAMATQIKAGKVVPPSSL